ncbi:MAG: AI-2E family transporter [Acidimicrobiales bacterium]
MTDGAERRMPSWVLRAVLLFWGVFALLVVAWQVVELLRSLLIMLLASLFLSLAIEPGVNRLARRGWRRGRATGTVMVAVLAASLAFVVAIVALVAQQVATLAERAPEYLSQIEDWLKDTFDVSVDFGDLGNRLRDSDVWSNIAGRTLELSATAFSALVAFLAVGLFTFYLVADGPRFRRAVCSRLRPNVQTKVLEAWEVAIDKTGAYLYSRVVLAGLSGLCHTVAFLLLGVKYSLALGLWVGIVSQFVPVIGTYLAGVLPVLVALVDDPRAGLIVVAVIVLYQQVENYLFLPRITARTLELHPALAFGAVIAGAALLGAVGALLAIPVAACLQAFATMYWPSHDLVESPLVTESVPASPPKRRRSRRDRAR